MKQTIAVKTPSLGEGKITSMQGGNIDIFAVENGYRVRAVQITDRPHKSSGEIYQDRVDREYVFRNRKELVEAVNFWATQQEIGK